MTTDIIIPQFNNAEYTVQLLESIRDCTKDYRMIMIENLANWTLADANVLNELGLKIGVDE